MDTVVVVRCPKVGGAERERATAGAGRAPNIGLQATANSLRSCLAAAIGGA